MADPIATEPLYVDGVRAHNEGDRVPAENVAANGWQDKVRGYTPKAETAAKPRAKRASRSS